MFVRVGIVNGTRVELEGRHPEVLLSDGAVRPDEGPDLHGFEQRLGIVLYEDMWARA